MKNLCVALSASVSLLAAAAAQAQTQNSSGPQVAQAGPSQGLEEVTVTAQRRSERLLSVPLAITATTALQLQNHGLKEITDLQFSTPGLLPENGVGYTQLYIRGVGNGVYIGDPSVSTFIDDVPRIYGSMVNSFVNVDRVEVLKGAQGGLYGRNATGGVVNIITKQPTDEFNGDVKFSYGDKNTGDAEVYLNAPLTDRIEWNISAERLWHDPYVKNLLQPNPLTPAMFPQGGGPILALAGITTPAQTAAFFNSGTSPAKGYGNQDFYAGDTKGVVHISEDFKVIIDADFARKRDSEGNQWYLANPAYAQASDTGLLNSLLIPVQFPAGFYKYPGNFETYNSTSSSDALRDYGGSVKALWSLPLFDVTNIFAYRAQQTLYEQNGGSPFTGAEPIVRNRKDFWYEELRAVSNGDGPFHWLAGATYLNDFFHGDTDILVLPPLDQVPFLASSLHITTVDNDTIHNYSVYVQGTYDLTSRFSATGSLRYINETNSAEFTAPSISTAGLKRDKLLPAGTLSYKLEDDGNVYLRYARGFKSGGINPVVPPAFFPTDYGKIYNPETVDTYEVGFKDRLFGRQAQITTAAFFNEYTGLQTTTVGNANYPQLIEAIVNAGSARTYGAEANLDWRIAQPLTLSLGSSYLEAEYLNFSNKDGTVLTVFDFSHQRMIYSPKWQNSVSLDLDQPINDRYRLVGSILTAYVSNIRGDKTAFPEPDTIKSYWLTNLRVGIHTTDDKYAFTVYVKNLFDKAYQTFFSDGSGGANGVWGDPRIVGAELEVKFD